MVKSMSTTEAVESSAKAKMYSFYNTDNLTHLLTHITTISSNTTEIVLRRIKARAFSCHAHHYNYYYNMNSSA